MDNQTKYLIIGMFVLIICIIGAFLFINFRENVNFQNNFELEEVNFSYSVLIIEDNSNPSNEIIIEGNKITIIQTFEKPTPCVSVNYTIENKNNIINIIPERIISNSEGTCIQVIDRDIVNIELILPNGEYILNLYEFWNRESPFLSKEIIINS